MAGSSESENNLLVVVVSLPQSERDNELNDRITIDVIPLTIHISEFSFRDCQVSFRWEFLFSVKPSSLLTLNNSSQKRRLRYSNKYYEPNQLTGAFSSRLADAKSRKKSYCLS